MKKQFILLAGAAAVALAGQAQTLAPDAPAGNEWETVAMTDGTTSRILKAPKAAGALSDTIVVNYDFADKDGVTVLSEVINVSAWHDGERVANESYKAGQPTKLAVAPGTYDVVVIFTLNGTGTAKYGVGNVAYDVIQGVQVSGDTPVTASAKDLKHRVSYDLTLPDGTAFSTSAVKASTFSTAFRSTKSGHYTNSGGASLGGKNFMCSDMSQEYAVNTNGVVVTADGTPTGVGYALSGCTGDVTLSIGQNDYTTASFKIRRSVNGEDYATEAYGLSSLFGAGGTGYATIVPRSGNVAERTVRMAYNDQKQTEDGQKYNINFVEMDWNGKPVPQASAQNFRTTSTNFYAQGGGVYRSKINPAMDFDITQLDLTLNNGAPLLRDKSNDFVQNGKKALYPNIYYFGRANEYCETHPVAASAKLCRGNITYFSGVLGYLTSALQSLAGTAFSDTARIEVSCNNFRADSLTGYNNATIKFDYSKADCTAPTATLLQFRTAADGKVTDHFATNSPDALLLLSAGDFESLRPAVYGFALHPLAAVKVSYSPNGKNDWAALTLDTLAEATTNDYGYVYKASLDQFAKESANKWYDLKIELADAAGNSQVQVLGPVVRIESIESSGVEGLSASRAVQSVAYYNLLGARSDRPFEGVNIVVTRYTDGTTQSQKVIR